MSCRTVRNDDPTVFSPLVDRVYGRRELRIAERTHSDENHVVLTAFLGVIQMCSAGRAEAKGEFRPLIAAPDILLRLTGNGVRWLEGRKRRENASRALLAIEAMANPRIGYALDRD